MNNNFLKLGTLVVLAGAMALPMSAQAQSRSQQEEMARRDKTRDEWRTIATVSGAAAILGLLNKDSTLTMVGGAGALYSLYRYDEDSKSKDRLARARAEYFKHDHIYKDGVRYNRRTVTKSGKKYYQFYKAPKSSQDWNGGYVKGRTSGHDNGPDRAHDQGKGKGKGNNNGKGKGKGHGGH